MTGLQAQLVAYINRLRAENGVPPVHYANTGYSRSRAEYMLRNRVFSHYDLNGLPPHFNFTVLDQYFYMEESLGYLYSSRPIPGSEVHEKAKRLIYNMVYDDAKSNWGHRDSILDPCFNYADVWVANDEHNLYLVIAMVNARVDWLKKPVYFNGHVEFEARVFGGMRPRSVFVYKDVPDVSRLSRTSYSIGELYAGVVPWPYYYRGVMTIRPERWILTDSYISVRFPLAVEGKGLYTVLVHADDMRGIKWVPYNKSRLGRCGLIMYSLFFH